MKRKAPWTDFEGSSIHEGDLIVHPSGESGLVCFLPNESDPVDQWRVSYAGQKGPLSRLSLQIGDKGRAVVMKPN